MSLNKGGCLRCTLRKLSFFRDSHGLITIELQNNPLATVEKGSFINSPSLLYLDISNCTVSCLNTEFFAGVPHLSHLDLSDNPLKNIDDSVFRPLVVLEELKLSNCKLSHLSPGLLANQHHLKVLDLADNSLTGVDWVSLFGSLIRLENLNLRRSDVRNLPADVFANNTFLRYLTLSENDLTDLDIGTTLGDNIRNLHYLDLSNCNLEGPLDEKSFAKATTLKTLNLANNRLSSRDLSIALTPLKRLTSLTLRNCSLTRLPKDTFEGLSELIELDISWSPLNRVFDELFDSLRNLEYLNMGYSNLSRLSSDTFSRTRNLKRLVLSGNKLGELETGLFKNLRRLETLEIENCGLEKAIDEEVFFNKTYGDLQELKMSSNPLKVAEGSLIPEQLSRLRVLDLSKCNISYLPDESFVNAKHLRRLNLNGNNFTAEFINSSKFLDTLVDLEYLDLSGNNLKSLSVSKISNNKIKDIKLTDNPWVCDCSLAEWWNWAIEKGDISHLIGSTLTLEDMVKKGNKRRKGLLCTFDSKTTPATRTNASRKFPTRAKSENVRTWARYLKESNCHLKKVTTEQKSELNRLFPEPFPPGSGASRAVNRIFRFMRFT